MTHRLIESKLPIAPPGEERIRERRSLAALVPPYPVHGWCAWRPWGVARAHPEDRVRLRANRPPAPPLTMACLAELLDQPQLLPPGVAVARRGALEFSWLAPGMGEALRITTDPTYYEDHPSSVEFWSAGNPLFPRTSC